MFSNIMVPIDGSPFSREAVLQGLRIASQSGASLRLVRVGQTTPLETELVSAQPSGNSREQSAEIADLYMIAAECRANSTVTVSAAYLQGPVVDSLLGYATRHRVDLIVMRSRGRSGLARAWFGSVADALIRESSFPVMVVGMPSIATAIESGLKISRILVPLDGSALAEQVLDAAVTVARLERASLTLLRVVRPNTRLAPGELQASSGPARARDVTEAECYLGSLLAETSDRALNVTRRVAISADVAGTILSEAEGSACDLIAIATRGRSGLARSTAGSVADHVLRHSAVCTMVLHGAAPDYSPSSPSLRANET
ncbi:MAG: universal stress protein [Gemmatimonadaceae bacterium]